MEDPRLALLIRDDEWWAVTWCHFSYVMDLKQWHGHHILIFASSVLRNILASQYASLSICLHQREKIAYFLLVLQIQSQPRAAIKFSEILRYKLFRSPNIKKYKPNYLRKSLIKTQFNSI